MQKYIGVKQVEAKPMTRGHYNDYRGWTVPEGENPADEGYVVKYEDGYVSWSPIEAFNKAYNACGVRPLNDTALLMISTDYKDRFLAEYIQLKTRLKGLKTMLHNWDNEKLSFTPTCPRSIYDLQVEAMTKYLAILEARAKIEDIKL
jgi:hypothetical protein